MHTERADDICLLILGIMGESLQIMFCVPFKLQNHDADVQGNPNVVKGVAHAEGLSPRPTHSLTPEMGVPVDRGVRSQMSPGPLFSRDPDSPASQTRKVHQPLREQL